MLLGCFKAMNGLRLDEREVLEVGFGFGLVFGFLDTLLCY